MAEINSCNGRDHQLLSWAPTDGKDSVQKLTCSSGLYWRGTEKICQASNHSPSAAWTHNNVPHGGESQSRAQPVVAILEVSPETLREALNQGLRHVAKVNNLLKQIDI